MTNRSPPTGRPLAFLFLGETLLIPHLYPILESLARELPAQPIDAWVATATHEALIGRWVREQGLGNVRLRRAPGWRATPDPERGANPRLPAKLPMLARLAPRLSRAAAVVCAEQTSLWLPRVLGTRLLPPFIKTSHGVGTMSARDDRRRHAAALTLVPSEAERNTYLSRGMPPERIVATGYVKAAFRHLATCKPDFANPRPVILYNPHWQRHRSSWWDWGQQAIERILSSARFNLIFAPHQRLLENATELAGVCDELSRRDDAVCDLDSFAAVDGSYPRAADIYLGDTSSQVLEFLQRPRPACFLNPRGLDWRDDPALAMWKCGEVLSTLDDLVPALENAAAGRLVYGEEQARLVESWLGPADGSGADRAAAAIRQFLKLG